MNIGDKIKELMSNQNISQKDLANRLNVQEATISRYVNNQREPNAETLANLATALNTTTDYILGKETNNKQNNSFRELKFFVARNATNLTEKEKFDIINVLMRDKKS